MNSIAQAGYPRLGHFTMKTAMAPTSTAVEAMDHRIQSVNRKMRELCADSGHLGDIYATALDHHLKSGGQRARACISLSCGTSLGLCDSDSIALAASVELLHNASLIQDDLQDRTRVRRGAPTVWKNYGADCAIGLTDLTIAAAFRALAEVSEPKAIPGLIEHLYRAISTTLRGQTDDLDKEPQTLESALSIARRKSGPLFSLALELPLHLAGKTEYVNQASEAAEAFGLGYQIYDDIVDLDDDLTSNSQSNTVITLTGAASPQEALGSARRLAQEYLETSTAIALELPSGCGQALADLAIHVRERLDTLFDE